MYYSKIFCLKIGWEPTKQQHFGDLAGNLRTSFFFFSEFLIQLSKSLAHPCQRSDELMSSFCIRPSLIVIHILNFSFRHLLGQIGLDDPLVDTVQIKYDRRALHPRWPPLYKKI